VESVVKQPSKKAGSTTAWKSQAGMRRHARARHGGKEWWLKGLFAHAADGILVCGLDGRFIDVNPAACAILGHTRKEILALFAWEIVAGAGRDEMLRQWEQMHPGKPITVAQAHRCRDGQLRFVEAQMTRVEAGRRTVIVHHCHDITRSEQIECGMPASERLLVEGQSIDRTGSWTWQPAMDRMDWSRETFLILGYPETAQPPRPEELLVQRVYAEDRNTVRRSVRAMVRQHAPLWIACRICMPDGAVKSVETGGWFVPGRNGEPDKWVGTIVDVTERQRTDRALRSSERLSRGQAEILRQVLDALSREPEPHKLPGHILSILNRQLGAHCTSLWLEVGASPVPEFHKSCMEGCIGCWSETDAARQRRIQGGGGDLLRQELLRTRRAVICRIDGRDPWLDPYRKQLCAQGITTLLAVPLVAAGRIIGSIRICSRRRRTYRVEEVELAQALAHQLTLAIQLTRWAEQSRQAAVREERNRLARGIHDTLAQSLVGVALHLEMATVSLEKSQSDLAGGHVRSAGDLARRGLMEARHLISDLRPPLLENGSFWSALESVVREATAGTDLQPVVRRDGTPRPLPPRWEEHLLCISQEALANTLRHARATRFEVRLFFGQDELRLQLRDNGSGFDLQRCGAGFGLACMRKRAEQMRGMLTIQTNSGQGTEITVSLPHAFLE
jgi:PAS domain S-box-containing protein